MGFYLKSSLPMYRVSNVPFSLRESKDKKKGEGESLMRHLVRGNILRFWGMFKNFHVGLQIILRNQLPGESGFPP